MESEVEKEKDDESKEVEAEEVEGTDALLSPNRKEQRDLAHDNIDKIAKK